MICRGTHHLRKSDVPATALRKFALVASTEQTESTQFMSSEEGIDMKKVTDKTFSKVVKTGNKVVVFCSKFCCFCPDHEAVVEAHEKEFPTIEFHIYNVTKDNSKVYHKEKLDGVPCTLYFKNGKKVRREYGASSDKELLTSLKEVYGVYPDA